MSVVAPPHEEYPQRERVRAYPLMALLFAPSLCLWLFAAAAADTTSPRIAVPALARLLDGLTGTSDLLRSQEPTIREDATKAAAGTLVEVPGFPVRGAGIPREVVLSGTREEWRRALLDQSAALLYRDGTRLFADDAEASRFVFGGGSWALSLLGGRLHDWLKLIRWVPELAAVVLAAGVIVTLEPVRRWRVLGTATAAGAAIPCLAAFLAFAVANIVGGGPGTLSGEAAAVVATLARGPLIEGGTVALGGLALWWWSGRPVKDGDPAARLAAARAEREARRRAAAGQPPEPRRPR